MFFLSLLYIKLILKFESFIYFTCYRSLHPFLGKHRMEYQKFLLFCSFHVLTPKHSNMKFKFLTYCFVLNLLEWYCDTESLRIKFIIYRKWRRPSLSWRDSFALYLDIPFSIILFTLSDFSFLLFSQPTLSFFSFFNATLAPSGFLMHLVLHGKMRMYLLVQKMGYVNSDQVFLVIY